jgi:hypothetical protein
VNTNLAIQASEWDPSSLTRSSNKKVTWKCDLGHIWNASVNNRARGDGCPYCGGKKVLKGFNDLATTDKIYLLYGTESSIIAEDGAYISNNYIIVKTPKNYLETIFAANDKIIIQSIKPKSCNPLKPSTILREEPFSLPFPDK